MQVKCVTCYLARILVPCLCSFFILPLPPPPPQAFLRLSSVEHSESPEKWRQARGPRNTLISLIINSNIRPNVIVSNCMGTRQILPNAHSDLTRGWGVGVWGLRLQHNNNNNNNDNNFFFFFKENTKITLFIDLKKIDFLQIQEYEY